MVEISLKAWQTQLEAKVMMVMLMRRYHVPLTGKAVHTVSLCTAFLHVDAL